MELAVRKFKSWQEVNQASGSEWNARSDAERLAAVTFLAEQIFWRNFQTNARPLPSIYPIVKRRGR